MTISLSGIFTFFLCLIMVPLIEIFIAPFLGIAVAEGIYTFAPQLETVTWAELNFRGIAIVIATLAASVSMGGLLGSFIEHPLTYKNTSSRTIKLEAAMTILLCLAPIAVTAWVMSFYAHTAAILGLSKLFPYWPYWLTPPFITLIFMVSARVTETEYRLRLKGL